MSLIDFTIRTDFLEFDDFCMCPYCWLSLIVYASSDRY